MLCVSTEFREGRQLPNSQLPKLLAILDKALMPSLVFGNAFATIDNGDPYGGWWCPPLDLPARPISQDNRRLARHPTYLTVVSTGLAKTVAPVMAKAQMKAVKCMVDERWNVK